MFELHRSLKTHYIHDIVLTCFSPFSFNYILHMGPFLRRLELERAWAQARKPRLNYKLVWKSASAIGLVVFYSRQAFWKFNKAISSLFCNILKPNLFACSTGLNWICSPPGECPSSKLNTLWGSKLKKFQARSSSGANSRARHWQRNWCRPEF